MQKRIVPFFFLAALVVIMIAVSACTVNKVGTIPRGTPDTGNGTPAVISTPTPDLSKVQPASADAKGKFYAFIRNDQLWVALKGKDPVQMSHFDYKDTPVVAWQHPVWSPGDRYIAVTLSANAEGIGGGGCPGPDFSTNGGLYLFDTSNGQLTSIMPSSVQMVQANTAPHNDFWQYIFWEDATHLLAWYNGVAGKPGDAAGLYRYAVDTHKLTRVLPLKALNTATLSNYQPGTSLLLSMRYTNGQLFYEIVVHPFEQQSQLVIYRHSLANPAEAASKVIDAGAEAWCATPQSGAYIRPGWDVSPDGELVVTQMIVSGASEQGTSAIQAVNIKGGGSTNLFTQLSPALLSHDLSLTWGPDSQTVVATQYRPLSLDGPYSATMANPTLMQRYTPNLAGQIVWRTDSSAFALQTNGSVDATGKPAVYLFQTGDTNGRTLLDDAHEFSWG